MSDYYIDFDTSKHYDNCPLLGYENGRCFCRGGNTDLKDPSAYFHDNPLLERNNLRNSIYYNFCVYDDNFPWGGRYESCSTYRANLAKLQNAKRAELLAEQSESDGKNAGKKTGGGIGGVLIFLAILFIFLYLWKNNLL